MKKKLKIEFCGLPGAGKSTLNSCCLTILRQNGCSVLSREEMRENVLGKRSFGLIATTLGHLLPSWRRAFLGLPHGLDDWCRFATEFPAFNALLFEVLSRQAVESWRAKILYAMIVTAYEHQLGRECDKSVLFDESFAQRCFSLFGYFQIGNLQDIVRYAHVMPQSAVVVLVATDSELCAQRIRRRERLPVLFDYSRTDLEQCLANGALVLKNFCDALKKLGVRVLEIDGEGDINEKAEYLTEFLLPFVENTKL